MELWRKFVQTNAPNTDLISIIENSYKNTITNPRYYHNILHIEEGFVNYGDLLNSFYGLGWAWIFHDIYYDPYYDNNEIESGHIAFINLITHLNISGQEAGIIYDLIQATRHGNLPQLFTSSQEIIHDIDLAGLGASYATFIRNTDLIRQEYSAVGTKDFIIGRIKFFSQLLSQKRIFVTNDFCLQYEAKARSNIKRWIEEYEPENVEKT